MNTQERPRPLGEQAHEVGCLEWNRSIVSFLAGQSEGELGLHCYLRQEPAPLTSAYKVLPGHQREVLETPTYSKPLQVPSVCMSHHSKVQGRPTQPP